MGTRHAPDDHCVQPPQLHSTDAKDALDTLAQQLDAGSLELDAITQLNGLLQQYSSRAPELLAGSGCFLVVGGLYVVGG